MKEKLSASAQGVKEFWIRTPKKSRVAYLVGAALILGLSLVIVLWLNRTDYVVLQQDMSTEDNATVIALLQEMNVPYALDSNRLMVPGESENTVRMQLATRGYARSGFGYDTFARGSSFTATQYDKEKWDLFQTQERLQATIETFPQVQSAVVNVSMPESNPFVLEDEKTEAKAAIKVQTKPGQELTAQQIQGIINIVKNSVPGLSDENISIADQSGDLRQTLDSGAQAAATKLELTDQVNRSLERRIRTMLSPVYGDRITVAVNSVLDTDHSVTESTTYQPLDPENPTSNPLDYQEIAREKTDQTGFAQGVVGANDNTDVPQYAAPDQEMEAASYYSAHDVYDYLVSSIKTQIVKEGLEVLDVTVAVILDANTVSMSDRDTVIDLVSKAAGVASEKVSVQSLPFALEEVAAPPTIQTSLMRSWMFWVGIGLALLAIVVMVVLMVLARRRREREALLAQGMEETTLLDILSQEEAFEPITIPDSPEQKLKAQIRDLATTDPEIVAQLIKTWLLGA